MGAKGHKADSPSNSSRSSARKGTIGKVHGHMHARKSSMSKHGDGPKPSGGGMSSIPTKKI